MTMRLRWQALCDLALRYRAVFRAAWDNRADIAPVRRTRDELAFLPAHLELTESPSHPASRWSARVIVMLVLAIVLVAWCGRLDIVVTARGQLSPDARIKVIQPAITGVIRQIHVRDGQHVEAGQVLVELDATQATADESKANASRLDAALAIARTRALLDAQGSGRDPVVASVPAVNEARMAEVRQLARSAYRRYRDKLDSARATLRQREAQLDSARALLGRLRATAPLARQQADAYRALAADQYVARYEYFEKETAALDREHELAAQRSHVRELQASIAQQRAELQSETSTFRHDQHSELERATQMLTQSSEDETKAHTRRALLQLTSPVPGTVQSLATHTLGGVATAAQALMKIVPDDSLEVEATVENKDIGFVKVGQVVAVKVEAFPYTRYGYLKGSVVDVSNLAEPTRGRHKTLDYSVRIRLDTNRIRVGQRWIRLTPGMQVSADIKTGRRSVAEYFLGPLVRQVGESLHER
ncbi:HlyD family type I secretion periplasmic adaptor subunit [Burkholderia gladioli]|nr:HlyD family type I secretion periplasmic adaptor subunit [Burkholderia gladioli]